MQLRHGKKRERERGRRESEREEGGRVRERECTIPRVFSSPGREEGRDGVTSSIPMATSDLTSFTNLSAISLYVSITHLPITYECCIFMYNYVGATMQFRYSRALGLLRICDYLILYICVCLHMYT